MERIKLSSLLSKGKLSFDKLWTELSSGVSIDFEQFRLGSMTYISTSPNLLVEPDNSDSEDTVPDAKQDSELILSHVELVILDDNIITNRYNPKIFSKYSLDQFKDALHQTAIIDEICSAIEDIQLENPTARFLTYLNTETELLKLSNLREQIHEKAHYRTLVIDKRQSQYLRSSGKIIFGKYGRKVFYLESDIQAFIAKHHK